MGFVYLIRQASDNRFKIGSSLDGVESRLTALQTGNPKRLTIYGTIESDKYEELEDYLHRKFLFYKKCGEWFAITASGADEILSQYGGRNYSVRMDAKSAAEADMVYIPLSALSWIARMMIFLMIGIIGATLSSFGCFEIGKGLAIFQASSSVAVILVVDPIVRFIWNKAFKPDIRNEIQ